MELPSQGNRKFHDSRRALKRRRGCKKKKKKHMEQYSCSTVCPLRHSVPSIFFGLFFFLWNTHQIVKPVALHCVLLHWEVLFFFSFPQNTIKVFNKFFNYQPAWRMTSLNLLNNKHLRDAVLEKQTLKNAPTSTRVALRQQYGRPKSPAEDNKEKADAVNQSDLFGARAFIPAALRVICCILTFPLML